MQEPHERLYWKKSLPSGNYVFTKIMKRTNMNKLCTITSLNNAAYFPLPVILDK